MSRMFLTVSTIVCVLALGIPTGTAGLTGDGQLSKIGKATKEAGKDVAKGTKEGAKKAGDVSEDAAKKTAKETKNVGKTVEGAVTPDVKSVRCKDGTVQTGKTNTDACRRHGGVKK